MRSVLKMRNFEDSIDNSTDKVLAIMAFVLLLILFVTAVVAVPQIEERQIEAEATEKATVEIPIKKAPQNGAEEKVEEKDNGVFIFEQPARTLLIDDILF